MEGFPEEKAELCLERQIISSVGDGRRNSKVVLEGKELKSRVSSNTGPWDTCLALGKAVARAGMSLLRFLTLWLVLLTSLHPMDAGTQA